MNNKFYLIYIILGPVLIIYSIYSVLNGIYFFRNSKPAIAEILTAQVVGGGKGSYWKLQVKYLNDKDEMITTQILSEGAKKPSGYQLGDKIDIYYDPSDCQNVKLKEWKTIYFKPFFFFMFGLIILIVGLKKIGTQLEK